MVQFIKRFLKSFAHSFALLGIVFIPFPFNIFPYQTAITDFFFGSIIKIVAANVFGIQQYYEEISSDSSSMFALVFILLCLSFLISFLIVILQKRKFNSQRIRAFIQSVFCYYLVLQLMNYGVDKIFKSQFYLPEPNILYTPFGQLDKDILFWSTMGVSYSYNLFIGSVQLIAAILIFFRKTRVIGLLLSCGIFANIIAINFSYDISVKLYTSFLFFVSIVALLPYLYKLYGFFILDKTIGLQSNENSFSLVRYPRLKPYFKGFVLFLILLEVLSPYVKNGNFNDDLAQRPFLHGAYEIENAIPLDSTLVNDSFPIKRIFIHRNGYLILQDKKDAMADFKLQINPSNHQFLLTDYAQNKRILTYNYSPSIETIELQYFYQKNEYLLQLKPLNWRSMPALENRFHWWIDGE